MLRLRLTRKPIILDAIRVPLKHSFVYLREWLGR